MFNADNWAGAFIKASGEDIETGFSCLEVLALQVKSLPGALFGRASAKKLEFIMRESVVAAKSTSGSSENSLEYAIRFIVLLVEKNYFKHIDLVLEKIKQWIDKKNGVIRIVAETAHPVDKTFEEELKQNIGKKINASKIDLKFKIVPELLGGYRLYMDGFYIDASLKGSIDNMRAYLEQVSLSAEQEMRI